MNTTLKTASVKIIKTLKCAALGLLSMWFADRTRGSRSSRFKSSKQVLNCGGYMESSPRCEE